MTDTNCEWQAWSSPYPTRCPALAKYSFQALKEGQLPFLDMKVICNNCRLSSTLYCKPTDTGLIINFHALVPLKYKRSVVTGFVHRIFRACCTWEYFHASLERAKQVLRDNQYPTNFYEPLIHSMIEKFHLPQRSDETEEEEVEEVPKHLLFLQYRGKVT